MSTKDECDINNRQYNSINLPTHGRIPKWLEDLSNNIINTKPLKKEISNDVLYDFTDLSNIREDTKAPAKILFADSKRFDKIGRKPNKTTRFGRRASLAAQIYRSDSPPSKSAMFLKSDYSVPKLDAQVDLDMGQSNLEKSWKSLSTFQQTHKGRLDSAKSGLVQNKLENRKSKLFPSTSSLDSGSSSYTPSFSHRHSPKLRCRSEMSNFVPFYVYSNIKKATEFPTSLEAGDNPLTKRVSSVENIYEYFVPNDRFSRNEDNLSSLPIIYSKSDQEEASHDSINHTGETHLNGYKMKIKEESRLREKIINELLTENERITDNLKHSYKKSTPRILKLDAENDPGLAFPKFNRPGRDAKIFGEEQSTVIIPQLPNGRVLEIGIYSTWGDRHYVGLNGIEIFGSDGKLIEIEKISACPADVNVLPENNNDPRVVTNLLDGVNRTQDDVHLWLAPFNEGERHTVTISFTDESTIAMIRIWNYNKSRIHSFRGVRNIKMTLDERPIFTGEIAKACGGMMGGVDAFGDTILFTTDDDILELISKNDKSYSTLTAHSEVEPVTFERPPTAATLKNRPYTGAAQDLVVDEPSQADQILLGVNQIEIILLSNWGYQDIIGLTGLEVLGMSDKVVEVTLDNLNCNFNKQSFNFSALLNGENVTMDTANMWLMPFEGESKISLSIQFENYVYVSGLRIWNYNESLELSYAGVKTVSISLNGEPLVNPVTKNETFLLRRAPGNEHYDFVQNVYFSNTELENPHDINSAFDLLNIYRDDMPQGFVVQLLIFSTWDDQYYCGLTEIELYNEFGNKIAVEEQNICAYPESINVLPDVNGDIRTPDKLIDGIHVDREGAHSWLAPIIPKCLNRIYVVMDQPITISLIKLWNYSKTPSRGVKEFAILVDDLLVYNGVLDKFSSINRRSYQSVIFTDNKDVLEREIDTSIRQTNRDQETMLVDENRMTTGGSLPNPDQKLRPFTAVSPFDRGYISH